MFESPFTIGQIVLDDFGHRLKILQFGERTGLLRVKNLDSMDDGDYSIVDPAWVTAEPEPMVQIRLATARTILSDWSSLTEGKQHESNLIDEELREAIELAGKGRT